MEDKKYIRFQMLAVGIGLLLLLIKFAAYHITNSNTIFSDAMESIVNVAAGSFALYSLILASKPRDEDHPYGHGKIEFISAGIEGALILVSGIGILYKSVESLIEGNQLSSLDQGIYMAGAAGLINFILGAITEHYGKQNNSPTMVASGKHLKSDGYTSAGMILGLTVVYFTNWVWMDSAIAIGFGVFIGFIGVKEMRKSIAGIMDEADFEMIRKLVKEVNENRTENWVDLHNFRTQKFGKRIHIDCHVTIPYYLSVADAHDEIDAMEKLVEKHHPHGVEMFIHIDPCSPSSCRICTKSNCSVRQSEHEETITWSLDNVLENRQHR